VADRARELVNADFATVALPAGADHVSIDVVSGDDAAELEGQRFPIADSVSGEVLRTGARVVLADAAADHRVSQPQVSGGAVGPAMWIPLTANGEPVGALSVARHRGATPFSDAELELVQLFAAHASVILEVDRGRDDVRGCRSSRTRSASPATCTTP
jgi:GAF domain-containing protein